MQRFDQVDRVLLQIMPQVEQIMSNQRERATTPDPALAFQQQTAQRFDQIEHSLLQIMALLQDMASRQHDTQGQDLGKPAQTDPTSAFPAPAPLKRTRSATGGKASPSKTKKTTRGKKLPRTLIPVRVFAEQHQVSVKAADRASKDGKMTVQRGRWLYNSRYITEALPTQGQQEFYELFHTRELFAPCKRCPHAS
jgi:hypothetical protein